jgi:hypothetical protein
MTASDASLEVRKLGTLLSHEHLRQNATLSTKHARQLEGGAHAQRKDHSPSRTAGLSAGTGERSNACRHEKICFRNIAREGKHTTKASPIRTLSLCVKLGLW